METLASGPEYFYLDQSNEIMTEIFQSSYGTLNCACQPFEEVDLTCGNGTVETYSGSLAVHSEECDEGKYCNDTDAENGVNNCTVDDDCNTGAGEVCRTRWTSTCTQMCRYPYCGDGHITG